MSTRLAEGDTAPAFTLTDDQGQSVSLSDFAGQRVVVYFYPAAMTPGCTTQAVDFTAAAEAFDKAGITVLGISPDEVDQLAAFRVKADIAFPLLSDPDHLALEPYGAWGERMLYGKQVTGVIRSTFVVDVAEDGTGTVATAQYNVKATGHVERLRRQLAI
ncbi:MAG TPA: thioredoxin-dependent thiol peroxidase [Candidatus Avipropionibacterium avicola]|uniref:thioredoxin-dependent peroxiredoxin n=1 Tax=Candidatus Avipropionibacterium avicola TaxID=2840701 RepID=A0A9D1KNP8_9ACTN|nr:thioredoxin-dependent thiol peroxidase [Candidatus Avipropionibacterium avicola]